MGIKQAPKLSFIVLSYNYDRYIAQTIRSILDQTVQDFEVIVVDDASSDGSCGVISSFGDPRIRLFINSQKLGGAASYNRAIQAAGGEYLVNLDADDWISPTKSEQQLTFLRKQTAEVLGTYVAFIDANGRPHPQDALLSETVNRRHRLNEIESWVGQNCLVRSSTLVERAAHMRIGLDDPTMIRACDYELWTRFLRAGARFAVVPEVLTFYRLHNRGVTHADPRATLLEMSYAMLKNIMPLIETKAAYPSFVRMLDWLNPQEEFARLRPKERYKLFGAALGLKEFPDFQAFCNWLSNDDDDPAITAAGRRLLAIIMLKELGSNVYKLHADIAAVTQARNFWYQQSLQWEQTATGLRNLHPSCQRPPHTIRRLLKSVVSRVHRKKEEIGAT